MDFARKQLMKYGWSEGKGLGRNEDGIATCLKPRLKFDSSGFGSNKSDTFTYHWWEHSYNSAANNLEIAKDKKGIIKLESKKEFKISTSKYIRSKDVEDSMLFGSFIKKSTLHGQKVEDENEDMKEESEEIKIVQLSDEDLYKACGGRTGHKAARHGHNLNGKLARIEAQDKRMLEALLKSKQENNISETLKKNDNQNQEECGEILKQVKKKKKKHECEIEISNQDSENNFSEKSKKRKRKQEECVEILKLDDDERENESKKRKKKNKEEYCEILEHTDEESVKKTSKKSKKNKKNKNEECAEILEQIDVETEAVGVIKKKKKKKKDS